MKREIIRSILSLLIPIKKGKIIFESFPDYSDNARVFSDYLLEHTDYHLIWSVRDIQKYKNTDRISFIEKDGGSKLWGKLKFIYHTVSSQFLFSTHASFFYASYRNKYVVLWHGMPLKRIARLQSDGNDSYLDNASYIMSASKYYVPIFQQCFGKNESKILPIGIPRNDLLFHDNNSLNVLGINRNKNEKLILYLPTFRKADGTKEGDTDEDVFNGILNITNDESREELNDYLRSLHLIMFVKPHPSDTNVLAEHRLSNLVVIPHSLFAQKDIQLNHVLHYADALLTDYSGVFIDYMNLNRPIGFFLTDLQDYTENRGFLFEKPLGYLPGMQLYGEDDFKLFCDNLSKGVDEYKSLREQLLHVYSDYNDADNCQRLAEFLGLLT